MNQEIKALWVAALRSGKYQKGKYALKGETPQGPEYCCLGVLCDLHRKVIKQNHWYRSKVTGSLAYQGAVSALPPDVEKWAGLSSVNPTVGDTTLMQLNDARDAPFTDIANEIERYL